LPYFLDQTTFLSYSFLKDYDAVIEPGAKMQLYPASDWDYDYYIYSVCPAGDDSSDSDCIKTNSYSATAPYFTFDCTPFDDYSIEIHAYSGSSFTTYTGTAKCMYVRREIRSLVSDDLSKTMDAMATIWTTSEEDGQALYGENFHCSAYFVSAHYYGSAGIDADYTHGGQGFVPQHSKLSNVFELAMQAVDPSVTLPYWDYTIDAATVSMS